MNGVIRNSNIAHKRTVKVNPIPRHYEKPGEEPYIKWNCPVCTALGNHVSITEGIESCPLCGVSLNWDRPVKEGDTVLVGESRMRGEVLQIFYDGVCKAHGYEVRNETGAACYIPSAESLTILDEAG